MQDLFGLSCDLSPENLHCDGEISNREAARRYRRIMQKWRTLESEIGRAVDEDEVWAWWRNRQKEVAA